MAVCSQGVLTVLFLTVFSGRFVTGLGVGSLSMAVPLYKYAIALHYTLHHLMTAYQR